jgi:ESS family glutamate:Na+ symporter
MTIVTSFCGLCILLLAGKFLRVKIPLLQKLYLPSCVIAGLLGLLIIQVTTRVCASNDVPYVLESWTAGWSKLPGTLINIVFAALFLGVAIPPIRTIWRKAGPQLAYGQIVAWGQYTVGLGLALVLVAAGLKIRTLMGVIVPVGFEGGHGTASGLADVFKLPKINWAEGADFALASATIGIISAIVVGMALINLGARRGWLAKGKDPRALTKDELIGIYPIDKRPEAGRQTVASSSVDSLALHLAILGLAILIGYGIKQLLIVAEGLSPALARQEILSNFPLFPLCMIGGILLQLGFTRFAKISPVDRELMQRLAGTALDFLVVAAISLIRIEVIKHALIPFGTIVLGGIIWNVFCVSWLARRLLPDAWFERAIAEMGQSMGVTATGLLLLRVVDSKNETPAAEAFAYKQLLHEPFMGGGLWTTSAVFLVAAWGAKPVLLISVGAIAIWLAVWWLFLRPKRAD